MRHVRKKKQHKTRKKIKWSGQASRHAGQAFCYTCIVYDAMFFLVESLHVGLMDQTAITTIRAFRFEI